jgi:HSP20 family protein
MALLNSLLPSFTRSASACASGECEKSSTVSAAVQPSYKVQEQTDAFTLTVQLPGVSKENLNISDEDGTLTVQGNRAWKQPSEWTHVYSETRSAPFSLSLYHDNVVDAEKAQAELKDGVLTLTLPKSEARKPRKIAIA